MTDVPGPPTGEPGDLPPPGATPNDPTTVQPVTAAGVPLAGAAGAASMSEYPVEDQPWYRKPGVLVGVVIAAIVLLGLLAFALLSGSDDDDAVTTDEAISMQITVNRTTDGNEPFATQQTATVTGPTDTPTGFVWVLPPNGVAPDPITAVTDGNGDVLFRWAPLEQLTDSSGWRSTLVISEVLPPNVTLGATDFNCLLERSGVSTQGVPMTVDISAALVTEERTATYSFPGHEFAPGDRMSCPIANGPLAPTPTTVPDPTTTVPETTTTVAATTTTVAATTTTTVASTTTVVETTTTVAEATTTTTVAPPALKSTVVEVIDGNPDLSSFANLITVAGLRDQLNAQDSTFTIVAPNNTAIADLLAGPTPPNLDDQATAQAFVLAHVLTGQVLTSDLLVDGETITFDVGDPQTIVVADSTITIGGAPVVAADATADTGVVHTLGKTLVAPAP
jgi:uncharacterized surface protein with fasciclin (FAS1) repeats